MLFRKNISLSALAAILSLIVALPTYACPRCRVAAGSLADEALLGLPASASDEDDDATSANQSTQKPKQAFSLAMGIDVTTAYFYRGYLQQDRGLIAQPFMSLSGNFGDQNGGLNIQPYLGWWNSIHSEPISKARGGHGRHNHASRTETREETVFVPGDPSDPTPKPITVISQVFFPGNTGTGQGWYEIELSAGTLVTFKDWWIDVSYHVHFYPDDTHDTVQEMIGKVAYDVAGFWDPKPTMERKFTLKPYVLVARELQDQNGDENTYIELGIEPTWKLNFMKQHVALSLPMLVGLSPDGLYYDPNTADEDETMGYAAIALKGSMALPVPKRLGHWYLNASITYLHLMAESTLRDNDGEKNEVIGTLGVGISF